MSRFVTWFLRGLVYLVPIALTLFVFWKCFRAIDGMAAVNPGSILVLTGGEPLLRRDLPCIARHASDRGMMVVVGTNGTLLTDDRIRELQASGVMGASISVDSLDPKKHDAFRRLPGGARGGAARHRGLLPKRAFLPDPHHRRPDEFRGDPGPHRFCL